MSNKKWGSKRFSTLITQLISGGIWIWPLVGLVPKPLFFPLHHTSLGKKHPPPSYLHCFFQLLGHVWFFATPGTTARQASLSFTISQTLLKLTSIDWVMPTNHLILGHSLLLLQSFPASGAFPVSQLFASGGRSIGASASVSVLYCFKIDFPCTGIWQVLLEVGDDYVQWLETGLTFGAWVSPGTGLGCRPHQSGTRVGGLFPFVTFLLPQENVRMDWRTLTFLIILKFDMLPSHDCLTPALVRAGLCSEDPVWF